MSARYPETRELVQAVAAGIGWPNQPTRAFSELVNRGALEVSEQRKFMKWWGGKNRPLLTSVVPMLRTAGMLSPDPTALSPLMRQIEIVLTQLAEEPQLLQEADRRQAEADLRDLAAGCIRAAEAIAAQRASQGGAQ